jgi:hypothetical protein
MLARLRRTREMSANTASFGTTMLFKRTMSLGDTMLRTHVYIMYTYTYWRRCYAKQLRAPAHVCRYSWARALDMFRRRVRCGRNTNRGRVVLFGAKDAMPLAREVARPGKGTAGHQKSAV